MTRETAAARIDRTAWQLGSRLYAGLTVDHVRTLAHLGAAEALHVLEMAMLDARGRRVAPSRVIALIRAEQQALEDSR